MTILEVGVIRDILFSFISPFLILVVLEGRVNRIESRERGKYNRKEKEKKRIEE